MNRNWLAKGQTEGRMKLGRSDSPENILNKN